MNIEAIFQEELERVLLIIPRHEWTHPFKSLQISKSKRAYGTANSKGIVQLSSVFRNTGQEEELRDTIRHEFAHLVVGIKEQHSYVWQQMAIRLGSTGKVTTQAQGNLAQNMKRQWRLMATTEFGREVRLKASHNRMSKYMRYKPTTAASHYTIGDGEKIVKFYYVRNK